MSNLLESSACQQCAKEGVNTAISAADAAFPAFKKARRFAKSALSFFGSGDYAVHSNSLVDGGGVVADEVKLGSMVAGRDHRISYREYLGDVISSDVSGNFKIEGYNLNPGSAETFPWLYSIAQNYEQWEPRGLVFEFVSSTSEYSTSGALGNVILGTEYDILDSEWVSKNEMMNSAYTSQANPTKHILHGVECAKADNPRSVYYVRHGAIPATADARDYDHGTFYIASQGVNGTTVNLGSLYVHYDIIFRKERVPDLILGGVPSVSVNCNPDGVTYLVDASALVWYRNPLDIVVTNDTTNKTVFTFNPALTRPGTYVMITMDMRSDVRTWTTDTQGPAVANTGSAINDMISVSNAWATGDTVPDGGAGGMFDGQNNLFHFSWIFKINGQNPWVGITTTGVQWGTNPTRAKLSVMQVDPTLAIDAPA